MIEDHEFNTGWWGRTVGIVRDVAFFELPAPEREQLLAKFAWAEFRTPLRNHLPLRRIHDAGFVFVDTQVHFRIALGRIPAVTRCGELELESGEECSFRIDAAEMMPFEHERFSYLVGVTPARLAERFALWCNDIIKTSPGTCFRATRQGQVQGWFVAEPDERGLNLSLAGLHREATVSGMTMYQRALRAFGERGWRVGHASFSVTNGSVHNIYAHLGARFVTGEGCWLWEATS